MRAGYEHEIPRLDHSALFPFVDEVEPWDDPPPFVRPADLSPVVDRYEIETANYGFEPAKPPFDDEPQIFLDPLNPQSDRSEVLFDMFEEMIAADHAYHDRLIRHYDMWKQVVDDPTHPDHAKVRSEEHDNPSFRPAYPMEEPSRRAQPKVGPNEPCPRGSGKKHKTCCRQ